MMYDVEMIYVVIEIGGFSGRRRRYSLNLGLRIV